MKHSIALATKTYPKRQQTVSALLTDEQFSEFLEEDFCENEPYFRCKACGPITGAKTALQRHSQSERHKERMERLQSAEKHMQEVDSSTLRSGQSSATAWRRIYARQCMQQAVNATTAESILDFEFLSVATRTSEFSCTPREFGRQVLPIKHAIYEERVNLIRQARYVSIVVDDTPAIVQTNSKHVVAVLATTPWLHSPVLLDVICTSRNMNASYVQEIVQNALAKCGVDHHQLVGLLADNARAMVKAASLLGVPHFSCTCHTLHLVVSELIDRLPDLRACISAVA